MDPRRSGTRGLPAGLLTADGGVVLVRVDSAAGAAENACTQAERAAGALALALPV